MALYNVFKAYLDGDDNPAEWYMFTTSCNVNEVRDYCRNKNREREKSIEGVYITMNIFILKE